MDKGLYVAMNAAKQTLWSQSIHANNLANANTSGFQADLAQFRSQAVYGGDGLPSRVYAMTENPTTNFDSGSMISTGRDLDVAIEGEGFLAVQSQDGSEGYTRMGAFYTDANGVLRVGNDLPVLGNGGPVALPPNQKAMIGVDGTISVMTANGTLAVVDRLKLVKPELSTFVKSEDGLLRAKNGKPLEEDASVRIAPGYLESSNVNAVNEFTKILELARQYEISVKMMSTFEDMDRSATSLMRMS